MIHKVVRRLFIEKQRIAMLMFFMRIKSVFYAGNTFTCNCCEGSFRKFLPFGNIPRDNACCPRCHSLERTRLLMCYLERETEVLSGKKSILHFAPEPAIKKRILRTAGKNVYIDVDINPALAGHVADITRISFPEESFDYVICSHVLGHVDDESKAVDEMYRVLKSGGEALIMTVIDLKNPVTYENTALRTAQERLENYGEPDLVRLHGRDFGQRLLRSGVAVEEIDYSLALTETEKKRLSVGNRERELIFRCVKRARSTDHENQNINLNIYE